MSEAVSVRDGKTLKEKIKKYKINVSKITREALKEEIQKHERQELANAVSEMKTLLTKVPDDEIVRAIQASRDHR
jgi:post-segregation antitoxin (ccd killing protein)